jgi:hypothetical protein
MMMMMTIIIIIIIIIKHYIELFYNIYEIVLKLFEIKRVCSYIRIWKLILLY